MPPSRRLAASTVLLPFLFGIATVGRAAVPADATEGTSPLSPSESLRSIRVPDGLVVELVAAEPLVQDPVAIDWGPDGQLWVCEMNDYPTGLDGQWQPGGRVRFLTDSDGDGRHDRSTLFLDGLPFPTGVMAWGRGVLVCAAPDILYAEDTDGDGRADRVEKLYSGFATENYQARVNGLSLGLDNWIHGANGLLGGTIQRQAAAFFATNLPSPPVNIRGHDFRFHPATGAFETTTGTTQQGRVRDDWGHWFGNDNSRALLQYPWDEVHLRRNPHAPAPDTIRFVPRGEDPDRLYPVSELRRRFNDPEAANRVTSACGLGLYRDSGFMPDLHGNAFICEPVHNLVHREVLSFDGFLATSTRAPAEARSEFLAAADPWFRPVQVRTGPDGALYVVDLYRFMVEHPRWIPAERLAKLDVRAGSDRGRIYRVRPDGKKARTIRDLTRLDATALAGALDSPNGTERDRVHAVLLHRRDPRTVPTLERLALGGLPPLAAPSDPAPASNPAVRVQALAVLDGLGRLSSEVLAASGKDPDSEVHRQFLRLCEARWNRGDAPEAVLDSVLALRPNPTAAERLQLALALGARSDPVATTLLVELAKRHVDDPQMRTAILASAVPHAGGLFEGLMPLLTPKMGRFEAIPALAATLAATRTPAELAGFLALVLQRGAMGLDQNHFFAAAEFSEQLGPQVPAPSAAPSLFPPEWPRFLQTCRGVATNLANPESFRLPALRIVGRHGPNAEDLRLLARVATEDPSPVIRRTALLGLRAHPRPFTADALLAPWSRLSPAVRAGIAALLLEREPGTRSLLAAIRAGTVRPTEIDLADRQRLIASPNPELRRLASECLPSGAAADRAQVIARYRDIGQLQGAAEAGKSVFARQCAPCHRLDGVGFEVGPDLVALRSKDVDYWVKNILDPNAVIEPRFIPYEADLDDGSSLAGLVRNETGTRLDLVAGNGVVTTIQTARLRQLRASRLSLMPEGFESAIPPRDMADLLAYLRPTAPGSHRGPIPWQASPDGLMRDARTVAGFILDPTQPSAQRENAVRNNPQFAAALISEFTRDLVAGTSEEYVRIPWIWRVAIACGRRNENTQIREVLVASLPATNAPLHDWQAVVLGGGLVNGMSEREPWPGRRLESMLAGDPPLEARWRHALELAAVMAEEARVPQGTRYDALRMVGVESFAKRGAQLRKHLAHTSPAELQMGAVSALADVPGPDAATALANALAHLTGRNRELALDALLRDEDRCLRLLGAVETERIDAASLGAARITTLRQHPSSIVRGRVRAILGLAK